MAMTKKEDMTSSVDGIGKTKLDEIVNLKVNPKVNPKTDISVAERDAFVRLVDTSSGGVLELHLEIDPVEEVVVSAKYRLIDMTDDVNSEDAILKLVKLAELVKGKKVLFCLTLTEDALMKSTLDFTADKRRTCNQSLTALKLALSEYIMRKYAVSIGITKNRKEFIDEYLKDHPMLDMLKKE
jgi:hypothetical protein